MAFKASGKSHLILLIIAFGMIYLVWGSVYFFIHLALKSFPPMLLGAVRYFLAGILLLLWCFIMGDKLFVLKDIINSSISGFLMLFLATGIVIWSAQTISSSFIAILASAGPLWFFIFDYKNWHVNLRSTHTIIGLILGFTGVTLIFFENAINVISRNPQGFKTPAIFLLLIGQIAWAIGSLYSKSKVYGSPSRLNTAWQLITAGVSFFIMSLLLGENRYLYFNNISITSWLSMLYLIFMGSIGAFSAYIWLMKVCSPIKVSTFAYVNPLVAILLGVSFANEKISVLQIIGLIIILISIFAINMTKHISAQSLKK